MTDAEKLAAFMTAHGIEVPEGATVDDMLERLGTVMAIGFNAVSSGFARLAPLGETRPPKPYVRPVDDDDDLRK